MMITDLQWVAPTRLYNMGLNCDVDLQHCFKMEIGEDTFIQASMLMLHRTLNSEATAIQLQTLRQGPIISEEKHKQIHKERFKL